MRPPTTSFRWSNDESRIIACGLVLAQRDASYLDLSAHDSETALAIDWLANAVREIACRPPGTHRVRLDAMQIAVCQFAIRSFDRRIRRGQILSLVWPTGTNKESLLKKLEKHRKRAKRKWLRFGDPPQYQELSRRWRRFLGWVRENHRPIRPRLLNVYKQHLNWVLANAKRVLAAEMLGPIPEDRELRKLVRKMIRHVRRGRAPVTMKELMVGSDVGHWFIAKYLPPLIANSSVRDGSPPSGGEHPLL